MHLRLRHFLTSLALVAATAANAQGEVLVRSMMFSDGVHPTFSVTFDDTDVHSVENHWRSVLKQVSQKVGGRKELIGMAAMVPSISADTIRILVKTETSKNLPRITLHVAFRTTQGYAGRDGDDMTEACKAYVGDQALVFIRENAFARLKEAEKRLQRLRSELDILVREHERAVGQREKALARASAAETDQERLKREVDVLTAEVEQQRAKAAAQPDEENERDLKDLMRTLKGSESALKSAVGQQRSSERRAADTEKAMERNAQSQEQKRKEITQQEEEVQRRTQVLEAVR